ncbi:unnamed protein product [Amoebophrya sp. A120]|nr:unnamed protein product [Amoebophrya sp. A120]|eukprot:GSA120T00023428001.1
MAATAFSQTSEPCGTSPSLLDNNMTASDNLAAFASRNKVIFLHPAEQRSFGGPQLSGPISYLRYVRLLSGEFLLCVGFQGGTQIYSEDGSFLLHLVSTEQGNNSDAFVEKLSSHRAACALLPSANREVLAFGDHRGTVQLVDYRHPNNFANLSENIPSHTSGVTCLECVNFLHASRMSMVATAENGQQQLSSELVVGHEDGSILWWTVATPGERIQMSKLHQDSFEDVPVNICATGGTFMVVGFGSGRLIVYTIAARERFAEIAAHARWITGLAFNPKQELLVSCAEDTVCNVWRVSEEAGVLLVHSSVVDTKLLTGCCWLSSTEIGIPAYDSEAYFRLKL